MPLLEQIKDAGIVGCGGAGFPTHVKLNCTVEHLIINAAECEPLLRTDRWLMIHKAVEIITAAERMAGMVKASHIHIALKETYGQEIQALESAISGKSSPVRLFHMRNFYPAGDEQIMVCDVTGRTVPPSGIPLDVGAVVSNLATTYSIYQASQGEPFTSRYLTVTGAVASPCILHAPLGTSFTECLKAAGGCGSTGCHVIAGGPLMGKCYNMKEAERLVVTKTTSGFILIPDDAPLVLNHQIPVSVSLKRAKMSCIQCSHCTQMCPRYLTGHPLKPHMIMRKLAYAQSPEDILEDDHVKEAMICSECGLCETYACPMGLKPRQVNIYLKTLLRQKGFRYEKPLDEFRQLEERAYRRAPSRRIAARLGVDAYYDYHIDECHELTPDVVHIPLQQHIGAPSLPTVAAGDNVKTGQLIGRIPEKELGANIHASICGRVRSVSNSEIIICAK
ncbi:MAG: 4Fe-4S dicluster domain-containing protein [Hungatella sp.]|jgi:Na+-translocating ferredoxin:NAD+ oxidoreductase RnfC subunit|nr:4Fe-4S dicluster domain-containing protein [Hungatella sp.]